MHNISASVSECMDANLTKMNQSMHHQMNASDNVTHGDMSQSNSKHGCCEKNACDMSHCANTIAAIINFDTQKSVTYTVSNVYLKPTVSLIPFYPSSLYRPPRV